MNRAARSRRALSLWGPPLLVMALIFAGSSIPSDGVDRGLAGLLAAKAVHLTEYFLLMLSLWRALRETRLGDGRAVAAAFVVCVLYACSDELHQGFVDGRNASIVDVAIDAAGAAAAGALVLRGGRDRRAAA